MQAYKHKTSNEMPTRVVQKQLQAEVSEDSRVLGIFLASFLIVLLYKELCLGGIQQLLGIGAYLGPVRL